MKTIDTTTLTQDLRDAHAVGLAAAEPVDDGQACNHDALSLSCRNTAKLRAAVAAAGGRLHRGRWHLVVDFAVPGQGAKRTAAAEAMQAYLAGKGYPVGVHYQAD